MIPSDIVRPVEGKPRYLKPIALLMGAETYSAAEDFIVTFDVAKRGIKIGQTTGGSTGQPLFFELPRGGMGRVCTKWDIYPDGKEFVGIGIVPDIEVKETVKDVREGRDVALEESYTYLEKMLSRK